MVSLGLVGVGLREVGNSLIEALALAQVGGDLNAVAGAGVRPGKRPAAERGSVTCTRNDASVGASLSASLIGGILSSLSFKSSILCYVARDSWRSSLLSESVDWAARRTPRPPRNTPTATSGQATRRLATTLRAGRRSLLRPWRAHASAEV